MTGPGAFNTDVSDMLAVHRALIGALDAAPEYVGNAVDDPERTQVVGSFYENVIEFLHVHHAGEDELIYPMLEERCAESRSTLERIDEQHKLLFGPMDDARAAISAWRTSPSAEGAKAVAASVTAIDEVLRPHLTEEEAVLLPIATKWMSPEEWGQMPGHAMLHFAGDKPFVPLGLLWEQLDQPRRDGMLAGMPPEMATALTDQMLPAYNAFIGQVRQ